MASPTTYNRGHSHREVAIATNCVALAQKRGFACAVISITRIYRLSTSLLISAYAPPPQRASLQPPSLTNAKFRPYLKDNFLKIFIKNINRTNLSCGLRVFNRYLLVNSPISCKCSSLSSSVSQVKCKRLFPQYENVT